MAKYTTAFTESEFLEGTTSVTTGAYHKIGEYVVQAGEMVSFGAGGIKSMDGATGRIYFDLKDNATTPANVDGKLRLAVHSAQDQPIKTLKEFHTKQLRTSISDRTQMLPFTEDEFPWVTEDKKLVLEFKPEANKTVSASNSSALIDMTLQYN